MRLFSRKKGSNPNELEYPRVMETRGFVIARHPTLGLLLLKGRAKKKKGKPAHFQLPGGKVNGGT